MSVFCNNLMEDVSAFCDFRARFSSFSAMYQIWSQCISVIFTGGFLVFQLYQNWSLHDSLFCNSYVAC
jgi:predicted membrane protein